MSDNDYDYEFSGDDRYSGHSDNGSSVQGASDFEFEERGRNGEDDHDQYEEDDVVDDDNCYAQVQPAFTNVLQA